MKSEPTLHYTLHVQWLKNLLAGLEKGCCLAERECVKETEEEAEARAGPLAADLEHANMIYDRIAAMSDPTDMISECDLIVANRGNFGLFAGMDVDTSGLVSKQEFINFIMETHSAKRKRKRGSGDKACLSHLLFTPC